MSRCGLLWVLATSGPLSAAVQAAPSPVWAEAQTTRYWDCCKPSCAWSGKFEARSPLQVCGADGSFLPTDTQSVCGGGGAPGGPSYACTSLQPVFEAATNTSFVFAAASLHGHGEEDLCCACYELEFSQPHQAGRVVVQVTNTGADLGTSHFNLMIPGGGFGNYDSCSQPGENGPAMFPGVPSIAWGRLFGGVLTPGLGDAKACDQLPAAVQPGCAWYFEHFGLDNPDARFRRVPCPARVADISGCARADEPLPAESPLLP